MGILEQVMELKGQGTPENEIINKLQEQGISPSQIKDALGQAKIKNAVSSKDNTKSDMEPSILGSAGAEPLPKELPTAGLDIDLAPMHSSQKSHSPGRTTVSMDISDKEEDTSYPQKEFYPNQEQQYPQPPHQSEEYIPQEYSPEQGYSYDSQGVSDTDTLIEISEQVFSEKIKPLQKQLENLNEFKVLAQTKINNISDRLKRIELTIDNLQAEILERVGSYGRGLDNVKKEMGMVQESFGKIVNTLADKAEERHKHSSSTTHTTTHKKSSDRKKTLKSKAKKR